jgi:hypothetical protein
LFERRRRGTLSPEPASGLCRNISRLVLQFSAPTTDPQGATLSN